MEAEHLFDNRFAGRCLQGKRSCSQRLAFIALSWTRLTLGAGPDGNGARTCKGRT